MNLRTLGILVSFLVAGLATPLSSFADQPIFVEMAPPQAKESTPPTTTKAGYVWSNGYWKWNGSNYDWVDGSWIQVVEPEKKWVNPAWTKQGNRWFFTEGHWE